MEEKYNQARNLYFQTDLSQAEIARIVGIATKTLYRWIRQDNWKRIKEAAKQAPAAIVERLYVQLLDLNDAICARGQGKRIPTVEEAEINRKLINSIAKLRQVPSRSDTIQIMDNFMTWLRRKDLTLAQQTIVKANEYIHGSFREQYQPWEIEYDADEPVDDIVGEATEIKAEQPAADIQQTPAGNIIPLPPPAKENETAAIPPAGQQDKATFELEFSGYWHEGSVGTIPAESGVYCVYECERRSNSVSMKKVIYIGEADNVQQAVDTYIKRGTLKTQIPVESSLSFSFAKAEAANRKRIATSLIFNTRPKLNAEYKEPFPYGNTIINSSGKTALLSKSFLVERKNY